MVNEQDTHTNHQAKPMTTRADLNGNYENQVVQQQQQQQPTSRGVYTKPPPLVSASQLASQQAKMASANQQQQQQQQNSWVSFTLRRLKYKYAFRFS